MSIENFEEVTMLLSNRIKQGQFDKLTEELATCLLIGVRQFKEKLA